MFNKAKNNKHLFQIFIYLILIIIFFVEKTFLVKNNISFSGHEIYSKLDNYIPFNPIFIIPYFSWFLFIAATGITFLLKSKIDFRKTFLSINICMGVGLLVYLIYPNYMTIRPRTYGKDIFSHAVKLLQTMDLPACVCPSLHVAVSISLCNSIINSIYFRNRHRIKISAIILTFFICISTLFVKQHSVIDVAFGFLLGIVSYIFVYKIYFNENLFPNHVDESVQNEFSNEDNVISK